MNVYICSYYEIYLNSSSLHIIELVSSDTEGLALEVCLKTHPETYDKHWVIKEFDNSVENNVKLVYTEDDWD